MKNLRTISFLFAAVNAACILSGCSKNVVEQPAHDYGSIAEIEEAANAMYDEYVQSISERKDAVKAGSMKAGSKTMRFSFEVIGTPPKDGYPIYIALRGGGVGDKAVADEQYASMKKYYRRQYILSLTASQSHGMSIISLSPMFFMMRSLRRLRRCIRAISTVFICSVFPQAATAYMRLHRIWQTALQP